MGNSLFFLRHLNGKVSWVLLFLGGLPVLAIILLILIMSDSWPTDSDGQPIPGSLFFGIMILSVPFGFMLRGLVAPFSRRFRGQCEKHKWIDNLWAVTTLIFLFCVFVPSRGHPNPKSKFMRDWKTKAVLSQIDEALLAYKTEYGVWPGTSNNRDLVRILGGDNPRKITFVYLSPRELNKAHDAIDGWDNPIRISPVDPDHPEAQSAGPDRQWNTPDDLTAPDGP